MRQLWVFLAYVAAAKLAILLALPPGYASPIWPAAGIAMAAVVVWGPSLTLAVFLGSIATNLRPDELMAHPMDQILLQLCLALGTSIQAYLGSLLYHALARRLPIQAHPIRVALEVFLLGPVACLTAATISSAALTIFHVIESRSFMTNWVWWWMGDSFGAGVLGPLFIRLYSHLQLKRRLKNAPYLIVPAGLNLLIIIGIVFHLNQNDSRNRAHLEHTVTDLHQHLQKDLNEAQQELQKMVELSGSMDPLTVMERFGSAEKSPWHSLWVPKVSSEERPEFEKSFGNAHLHFTILEKTATDHLAPAGTRAAYWPLIFKMPHKFNLLPPGFDLGSLPEIHKLLNTAWENSETLASPLLTLGQNKKAVLFMKRGIHSQNQAFNQGLFIIIVPIDALIQTDHSILNPSTLHVQIKSSDDTKALYQSWIGPEASDKTLSRAALYGDFRKLLQLGTQTLHLQVQFPAEAFNSGRVGDPIFTTMVCIILAFTLNVLLISQQNNTVAAHPLAKAQHDELLLQHEAMRDADRSKANLLTNISHQIKSPLHGILGLLDMLRGSNLDHKQRSSIDTIIANCQSMRMVLDDIHTYASMETGQLALASDEFLVEDLLQELTSVYELAAEERQNNFKTQIEMPGSLRVQGDRRKLHRILSHLLSDSIRRTQKGRIGFKISLSGEQTLVFAIESIRGFQDEVYDNDREFGNTKAYQPLEIYNLKICDRIVQAMGGRLSLERPSALSSLVTLTLPLPIIASRDNTPQLAEQQHQDVLIVDDNIINLTVVSGLLMKLGYSVETAGSGREAIEKVKHKRYDVILMDCQMPHMDGYETTRSIRDTYRPERGPLIIALTANPLDDGPAQAKQAGMDSMITKPISLDMLIKTVGYAKKMPTAAPLQAVMIMDFKAFSMGLGNDHELMQTAIMRYFEEIDGMMDRLRTEVERGDAMATAKSAHTLKGMTSLFAAQSLVEAHRNLEMAGKEGRIPEFPGLLKRIESLTELFKMELKKLTDEKKEVA